MDHSSPGRSRRRSPTSPTAASSSWTPRVATTGCRKPCGRSRSNGSMSPVTRRRCSGGQHAMLPHGRESRSALALARQAVARLAAGDRERLEMLDILANQAERVGDYAAGTGALEEMRGALAADGDLARLANVEMRLSSSLPLDTGELGHAAEAAQRAKDLYRRLGDDTGGAAGRERACLGGRTGWRPRRPSPSRRRGGRARGGGGAGRTGTPPFSRLPRLRPRLRGQVQGSRRGAEGRFPDRYRPG